MSELLFTSSLDPIEEGQVFTDGLPRHVTLWQHFNLPDGNEALFLDDTDVVLQSLSPLTIIGRKRQKFGPNNDVPVRRVDTLTSGATLQTFHAVLGNIIMRHGGVIQNPEWAYENYNPHITFVDGRALNENEKATLATVELIEQNRATRAKIVRKIWELS